MQFYHLYKLKLTSHEVILVRLVLCEWERRYYCYYYHFYCSCCFLCYYYYYYLTASSTDIPVLDSEELLGLEEFRTTNHEEINSIVCLDDESKMNGPSTATPGEGKGDYPSAVTATPTVLHNNENDSSIPTCNKSPPLAASNAHSSPSSTTVADMAKPHQKRQLEDESSPACKKLCLESPKS